MMGVEDITNWLVSHRLDLGQDLRDVPVDRDDQSAKFWLNPVTLARNLRFSPVELRRIQRMLKENKSMLLEKWNERFGS